MRRAAEATGARMGWPAPLPNSSRLIDWGHSWVAPPPNPYGITSIATAPIIGTEGNYPWAGEQWPFALRDALGIGSVGYTKSYQVQPVTATASLTTILDVMPDDGTIESVWYVPNGNVTGAASPASRTLSINVGGWFAASAIGSLALLGGVNLSQYLPQRMFSVNDGGGLVAGQGQSSPYMNGVRGVASGTIRPQEIYWTSTAVGGTGLADPGGVIVIRYGTRYRNYGVVGATLLGNNLTPGATWNATFSWAALTKPNGVEVNLTALCNSTTVTCSPLRYPIAAGEVITFTVSGSPVQVTVGGATPANFGVTTFTLTGAPSSTIPAGAQGHAKLILGAAGGNGETLSPTGINVWTHGLNDANATTQDTNAWTETVRACIARCLCPAMEWSGLGNWVTANGGGTWTNPLFGGGSVVTNAGYASAMLPTTSDTYSTSSNGLTMWTGSSPTASDTLTVNVGPAFEGGTMDLFLLAIAGSSLGVAGSVTVDGTTPPQGTVTFNTSGQSISGLLTTSLGSISTSGSSTTVTGTGFSAALVGQYLSATGGTITSLPAGTFIVAVASPTSLTVSQAINVSATTGTASQYTPMVKRITGLAAGAHSITVTITGSDGAHGALLVYGLGLESINPATPVLWCNIARCPYQTTTQKTNSAALNTASAAVIAGTAVPLSGNTAEPGFGQNVQYVDIDTLFGANAAYFIDGAHLNSRGHRFMAHQLFNILQTRFTPDQLISR